VERGGRLQRFLATPHPEDLRAELGEGEGNGPADTGTGSGHYGHLSREGLVERVCGHHTFLLSSLIVPHNMVCSRAIVKC
jgi:hypothetical protein